MFYAKEAYARLKTTNDSYLVSLALGDFYWGLLAVICFSVLAVGLFVAQDNKKRKKEEQLNLSLRIKEQEYSESQRYLQDTQNFVNRLKKQVELELLKRVSVVKDLKNQLDRRLQEEINGKVKLQSELHQVQQDKVKIEERLKRVFDMVKINKGRQAKKQHIDLEKGKALFFDSDLYYGLYSEWTKMNSDQWVDLIDWIDHLLFIDFTHRIKNLYPGISEV